MPKPSTFPTLYNEVKQIDISKLKGWGYLAPEQIKSGIINWSHSGNQTGSISIVANTLNEPSYIELVYKCNGKQYKYNVFLTSNPSNLNRGKIWYFICPVTNKRCRKLYLISGYFLHREAFKGCMYDCQTQSKKYRQLDKILAFLRTDSISEEIYKKHFKKTYAGKPTKRYLRIIKKVRKAESIPGDLLKQLI